MKFKKILALLILINTVLFEHASNQTKGPKIDIKVLVLIIASDNFPVYIELAERWKKYMHYDPDRIEAYFLRSNPQLTTLTAIEKDIIWSRVTDGWAPQSSGILDKTILSLEAMLPRIDEFDYVLRTNLSSFYVFPSLLEVLKNMPRQRLYFGSSVGGRMIGSGSGFIISNDIAKLLVQNKNKLIGLNYDFDDIIIGSFLQGQGVALTLHDRCDFYSIDDWNRLKDNLPLNIFHFRVKNDDHFRLQHDIYINTELFKRFYPYLNN